MQRLLALAILTLLTASFASAQGETERRPNSKMGGGLYNLTEVQYGLGLNIIEPPFSQYIAGATTVFGWRFGGGFAIGGGTGYLKYNDGYTIPLYADMRYFLGKQKVQFFFAMPAGFLMNFDNFRDYSKVFGNPSLGLIVPISSKTHLSFSVGLFTQIDREIFDDPSFSAAWHDSFINLKLGLLFDI